MEKLERKTTLLSLTLSSNEDCPKDTVYVAEPFESIYYNCYTTVNMSIMKIVQLLAFSIFFIVLINILNIFYMIN